MKKSVAYKLHMAYKSTNYEVRSKNYAIKCKAQFFTLDALLALIAAAVMTSMIIMSFKTVPSDDSRLQTIAADTLRVLDDGRLLTAVQGNTTTIDNFLKKLPDNICGRITISDTLDTILASVTKQGCGTPIIPAVQYRTVVKEGTFYLARMEAWWV